MASALDATIIRSDADLLEIALGYFAECDVAACHYPVRSTPRRLFGGQHQQHCDPASPGDRAPPALSPSGSRREYLRAVQEDPQRYAAQQLDYSRRRADKWLSVLQEHHRDFTFAPAICQRSVDIARGKIAGAQLHDDVVARLYADDVARRRENESERELQAAANRMLRQHQLLHERRTPTTVIGGAHFSRQPSAATASARDPAASTSAAPTPSERRTAGQRASERLYRLASQPYTTGHEAAATAPASSSRALTPRNTGGSARRGAGEDAERASTDSPVATAPAPDPQQQHDDDQRRADPHLFRRLYSDAQRLNEKREQRLADATYIPMKKLYDEELADMLHRVHDEALEARAAEFSELRKKFRNERYRPEIDPNSARLVVARNSAAGEVFHRLSKKPAAEH